MAAPVVRDGVEYSEPDQVKRFANAKANDDKRYLDITTVYDGSGLKGQRVLITGVTRGLGLELSKEIIAQGGFVVGVGRRSTPELEAEVANSPENFKIIMGIDVASDEDMAKLTAEFIMTAKEPVDIVINCAGYFYGPEEKIGVECEGHMNFPENIKQIDICGVGPLRVTHALYKADCIKPKGKVIIISSQAGSCEWRLTQCPPGGAMNYGHHMSRAACSMAGVLMAQDFKTVEIPVVMLHPGFNRTEMTRKYEAIWDIEGAVEPHIGAKRVLYETMKADMSKTGTLINCEDGLRIPW